MIKIVKVWDCFNANSSSNHGAILIPETNNIIESDIQPFYYTWRSFVLLNSQAKREYIATSLFHEGLSTEFIKDFLNVDVPEDCSSSDYFSIVRRDRLGNIHIPYLRQVCDYIINTPTVAIYAESDESFDSLVDCSYKDIELFFTGYIVQDGDYFVNVNPDDGKKVVFTFNDNLNPDDYKPTFPYLVDLKITNKCSKKCEYCYQGSTPSGLDANYKTICETLDMLAEAGCIELAIGGGEPTEHKRFGDIIKYAKSKGFIVNFTTKTAEFSNHVCDAINEYVSCVALSYDGTNFEELYSTWLRIKRPKKYIQIIPAIMKSDKLKFIVDFCNSNNTPLTLLGYKFTGRGKNFGVNLDTEWANVEYVLSHAKCKLIGDTALLSRYPKLYENTPKTHFHINEGEFSLYIDVCIKQHGRSSYHLDTFHPYDNTTDFKAVFLNLLKD